MQLAAGVVGAVIGSFFGAPQLGWAIGVAIGGAVFAPTIKNEGPRLEDLKYAASSFGTPISYVIGHPRVPAIVVWNSDRREIKNKQSAGGKGGPDVENTTYTYEIDLLIKYASNAGVYVRRIWSNGKLVWTAANDADLESVLHSQSFARRVSVYPGGAAQMPDPTYEAAVGVGNAPGYRSCSTLFIEGLDLGGSGQVPNLTFEVVQDGTIGPSVQRGWDVPAVIAHGRGTPAYNPDGFNFYVLQSAFLGDNKEVYVYRCEPGATPRRRRKFTLDTEENISSAISGNSDVSGIIVASFLIGGPYTYYGAWDGLDGAVIYEMPESLGTTSARFCRRDDRLIFGSSGTGSKRLYSDTGEQSAPLAQYVDAIAIDSTGQVYALSADGSVIYVLPQDLSSVSTIATPGGAVNGLWYLVVDEVDRLCLQYGGKIYRYENGAWAVWINTTSGTQPAITVDFMSAAAVDDIWYSCGNTDADVLSSGFHKVNTARNGLTLPNRQLDEVVLELCERAGLSASDVDVTELAGQEVRALALSNVGSTRVALELLMQAYWFEAVETDRIYFRARGSAPVATIPFDDLGATANGANDDADPIPLHRSNESEIAATVTVRYSNALNDYQDGAERSYRITDSKHDQVVELALALTPTEAKQIADKRALDYSVNINRIGPIRVDRSYAELEPCDVVLVEDSDGSTYRIRLGKCDDADGVRTFEAVFDEAIESEAATDSDYTESTTVRAPGATFIELIDGPILRDADDESGFYVAASAISDLWPGYGLFASRDDVEYEQIASGTDRAVMGIATTALGNWTGGNFVDERNTVTVDVTGELSSITHEQLVTSTANAILIGDEVLQFKTATLVSAGVYTLSGLLRGRRGTEHEIGNHDEGDRVVLLRSTGLRRVAMDAGDLNLLRYYRGVTFGRTVASAESVEFTNTGNGLKPFSVQNVRGSRDAGGDLTITWDRRTRLSENWLNGTVPLGESSEQYEVDVMDGSDVVRTISSTTASATYTAADQATDFGSAQSSISVRVYQLSDVVGRGYVATATV